MDVKKYKIESYAKSVSDLPDYPSDAGLTAAMLKSVFDARSDGEIKEKHNSLVDAVEEVVNQNDSLAERLDALSMAKVDKEAGKSLSSVDFTEDYRIMVENADMAAADAGNEIYFHKENMENPHKVTAEQVGTYSKGEIDVFVSDLGDVNVAVGELSERVGNIEAALNTILALQESLTGDEG